VWLLATHPEQWELLHSDPSLARAAFLEALRYESPVQVFSRTAARSTVLAGVEIAEDERVMVFFGSANRDPRHWEDPERFDILRPNVATHLAFGGGIHRCVGRPVAHLEGELLLGALARKVKSIEPGGEPCRKLNNTIRSFGRLPIRVRQADRKR
jgi:cytochrome P450